MEKLINYLNKSGFWFSCSAEQDVFAQEACKQGILQPIENLLEGVATAYQGRKSYFYVRAQLKCKEELPTSMWRHFIQGIGC